MGKGDIKSKRGKINNGSYGVRRKRKKAGITAIEIAEARIVKAAKAVKAAKPKLAEEPVVEAKVAKTKAAAKPKATKAKA